MSIDTDKKKSKKSLPSLKQRRIVQAKIKGVPNKDIGALEYPDANPTSQRQLISRELKKEAVVQYLEQSKLIALKEHNISWSRIIKPISEALEAVKQNNFTGEITTDHTTRLSAAKQAKELIEKAGNDASEEDIKEFAKDASEMEIVKTILRK